MSLTEKHQAPFEADGGAQQMDSSDLSYHKKAIEAAISRINLILGVGTALAATVIFNKITGYIEVSWRESKLLLFWVPEMFFLLTGAHFYANLLLKDAVQNALSSSLTTEDRKELFKYTTATAGWFLHGLVLRNKVTRVAGIKIYMTYLKYHTTWVARGPTWLLYFASLPIGMPFGVVEHRPKMIILSIVITCIIFPANWFLGGGRALVLSRLDPGKQ